MPGLRDAIFRAADTGNIGAHGTDVDDRATVDHTILAQFEHVAGDGLRQEERPFEVDIHNLVVAFFGHLQNIDALPGSHTGVVHQQINASEINQHLFHQGIPVGAATSHQLA